MPAVGVEYRFPFVGQVGTWGIQQLEPIAQVIARPNEGRIGRLPNEDAQSFAFDDSNLFNWNKFSGYDRAEGGVRANTGLKYSVTGPNSFYGEAMFGQSYHLAGRNSFAAYDLVNTGRDSGLESDASDYVGRFLLSPNQNFSLMTRARFDQDDLAIQRFEAGTSLSFNPYIPLTTGLTYARYEAQPELGYDRRREGIMGSANYAVTPPWSIGGSVLVDLDKYLVTKQQFQEGLITAAQRDPVWSVTGTTLGLTYRDECTVFNVSYSMTPRQLGNGTTESDKTLLVSLQLLTLGEANIRQRYGQQTQDGVASQSGSSWSPF
jgi:LPS-assembly protein